MTQFQLTREKWLVDVCEKGIAANDGDNVLLEDAIYILGIVFLNCANHDFEDAVSVDFASDAHSAIVRRNIECEIGATHRCDKCGCVGVAVDDGMREYSIATAFSTEVKQVWICNECFEAGGTNGPSEDHFTCEVCGKIFEYSDRGQDGDPIACINCRPTAEWVWDMLNNVPVDDDGKLDEEFQFPDGKLYPRGTERKAVWAEIESRFGVSVAEMMGMSDVLAKRAAQQVPTETMQVADVRGALTAESEANVREAIETIEAVTTPYCKASQPVGAATTANEKIYVLDIVGHNVEVTVFPDANEKGQFAGRIWSDLKDTDRLDGATGYATSHWDTAMDAIEALVLAHACAGVDVSGEAYVKGLEDAVTALDNKIID